MNCIVDPVIFPNRFVPRADGCGEQAEVRVHQIHSMSAAVAGQLLHPNLTEGPVSEYDDDQLNTFTHR